MAHRISHEVGRNLRNRVCSATVISPMLREVTNWDTADVQGEVWRAMGGR